MIKHRPAPPGSRNWIDLLPIRDRKSESAAAHFGDAATRSNDGTYTAELGALKHRMDALTMDEREFVETVVGEMPPRPANYEDVIAANLGHRRLDDEEAFELELGPNNCAASEEALTN